jgi:aspartate aminotransferase
MTVIAREIEGYMAKASFIRKMFEKGMELKKEFGAENVFDFSLGNPDLPPPREVADELRNIAGHLDEAFVLGYMPNSGYPDTREIVAAAMSKDQGVEIPAENVIMTCGAAGGLNAFFRATLNPGDEVICPAPYFVEYGFYVGNSGGKLRPAMSKDLTFELDLSTIAAELSDKTRAVLINSPNNPSGVIYSRNELVQLAELLREHSSKTGQVIYLVSDEPYRFLNYDGYELPSVLDIYEHSVIGTSWSKSLSLAGERIGCLIVNPAMPEAAQVLGACTLTNRILGFVNAPAIAQKLLTKVIKAQVNVDIYRQRRDAMAAVLDGAGIKYSMPKGAFYFFPQAPIADDFKFCDILLQEKILAVPGSGFGCPGYFRLTFCAGNADSISRSADAFKRAMKNINQGAD